MAVRIDMTYNGGLQCTALHAPSHDKLSTDAPKDNQGQGAHFSPTDLLATALGTCVLTTMGIGAKARSINMDGATAVVHKEMGLLPRRHVSKLTVAVTLPGSIPQEQREVLEKIGASCPVSSSLAPTTEVALTFEYK